MKRRAFVLGACTAPWLVSVARAADTPVKIVVGATPGGGTDLVARALANELRSRTQRQYIVDNRPGAGGNIAAAAVAKSDPDLSTLLLCYTSHAINPSLFPKLPFDPVKDFTPLSLIARSPLLLVARTDFPANNLRELLALIKANPGKHSIGIAGLGSANHLAAEMMKKQGNLELTSVPYKGAGPAVTDALGGQVDLLFSNVASVQELIAAKRMKVLAVSTAERVAAYPTAAPVAEVLPGFDFSSWYGLLAPAGVKPADAERLAAAAKAATGSEEMRRHLSSEGLEPVGSTAAEFSAFLKREIERWGKVVAITGAKI
jgi:tripartite-type tricarboxylate transporter receptor subunit TctC